MFDKVIHLGWKKKKDFQRVHFYNPSRLFSLFYLTWSVVKMMTFGTIVPVFDFCHFCYGINVNNYTMDTEFISHIKNHITFFPLSSVELVPNWRNINLVFWNFSRQREEMIGFLFCYAVRKQKIWQSIQSIENNLKTKPGCTDCN